MATKRSAGASKKGGSKKGAGKRGAAASKKGASKKASKKGAGKRALGLPGPFPLPPCVQRCLTQLMRCMAAAKTQQERTRCFIESQACLRRCFNI